jgi:hypothetical protein
VRAAAAAFAVWRCFPWDPQSRDDEPFSPSCLVPGQTVGRFDLRDRPAVRYLSDSPEHALSEALGAFRGTAFRSAYLRVGGHRLALVEVALSSSLMARIVDGTDPAVLARIGLRPDQLAHHDRTVTQAVARRLHGLGAAGLRWWSALTGAWHTTIIFTDRERARDVTFGVPRFVEPSDAVLGCTLAVLGIRAR